MKHARTGIALLVGMVLVAAACDAGNTDSDGAETASPAEPAPPPPEPATVEPESAENERRAAPRSLAWVAVEDARQLVLVDVEAGEVVERHGVPAGPHNIVVSEDGTAAAALYAGDHLALVDEGDVRLVELGATPHDVKAVDGTFVVANESARRIDLVRDGRRVGRVPLTAEPHDVAIAPSGETAWATLNGTDELAVVSLPRRRVERYVATGQAPHDILVASDGRVWTTDWRGPVHVFARNGDHLASVDLGEEAHHLAFTPDGREAWITDHGVNRVFVVDARSLDVAASLRVPGSPHHVAITGDGRLAIVADHDNGTVVVYDVERRKRVGEIEVGAGPHGVWAVPTAP